MNKHKDEKNIRIICIKAPKWLGGFLKRFQKKEAE